MSITTNERAEFTAMMNKASDEIESLRAEVARLKTTSISVKLLEQIMEDSKANCERQFGHHQLVDWVVSDVHKLLREEINAAMKAPRDLSSTEESVFDAALRASVISRGRSAMKAEQSKA